MEKENILSFIKEIPNFVSESQTILFIIDGLGLNEINLSGFKKKVYKTVFPSSTPTFFYSFHSLLPPNEHGFLEWYMRFKDNIIAIPPWKTIEGKELELGKDIKRNDIFPFKSLSEILSKKGFSITYYTPFYQTSFTEVTSKGAYIKKIDFLSQVFPLEESDFIYIYWPSIDLILHERYKDESFKVEMEKIKLFIKILKKKISKGSKLFIFSDHGHVMIKNWCTLPKINETYPVGGARVAFYKDVEREDIEKIIKMKGIPANIFELNELYFESFINKRCYKNFGNIVLIAKDNFGFKYPFTKTKGLDLGAHGGISKEEIYINLWIFNK